MEIMNPKDGLSIIERTYSKLDVIDIADSIPLFSLLQINLHLFYAIPSTNRVTLN